MKSTENRADHKEQRITELEDRNTEIIPVDKGKNKIFFLNEDILQELFDSFRNGNIRKMGIPEEEEIEWGVYLKKQQLKTFQI